MLLALPFAARAADDLAGENFIQTLPMQAGPYQSTWQSMAAQYQVPDWFRDAKLGIFLHWGPCSVPARHGWYEQAMYLQDGDALPSRGVVIPPSKRCRICRNRTRCAIGRRSPATTMPWSLTTRHGVFPAVIWIDKTHHASAEDGFGLPWRLDIPT